MRTKSFSTRSIKPITVRALTIGCNSTYFIKSNANKVYYITFFVQRIYRSHYISACKNLKTKKIYNYDYSHFANRKPQIKKYNKKLCLIKNQPMKVHVYDILTVFQ